MALTKRRYRYKRDTYRIFFAMMKAIGLMSGTSLDGVDIALIETDGETVASLGPSGYRAYTPPERDVLRAALADAVSLTNRHARPGSLAQAERIVTTAHVEAVEAFIAQHSIARESVEIVGFHGQTVLHRPVQRLTVQIGDAAELAKATGIPVVHDYRAADGAAGGQGAPFVPVYHRALAKALNPIGPIAVVNIGGVSNISFIDGDEVLIACDTGPGNALLDDFVSRMAGQSFDDGGSLASQGKSDAVWLASALKHSFFQATPPKSLDRNEFASLRLPPWAPADGAATLTAFTVEAIAAIAPLLPRAPRQWIVTGGGARNLTMMQMLRLRLAPANVRTADDVGWSADAMEAQAFAFLAARSLKGLPLSYPATTGVPMPMTGGVLVGV